MLTDFARDHAFTIAWFGLMAFVWFGWGQEGPRQEWRPWLGLGSALGVVIAGVFGYGVFLRWEGGSALEDVYAWFGVLTAAQVVAAGLGSWWLWRRQRARWIAWWVAVVVAVHFIPLAVFLGDWSLVGLVLVQAVGLVTLRGSGRLGSGPTSRLVGPLMGATLLAFALVSAVLFVLRVGLPWSV